MEAIINNLKFDKTYFLIQIVLFILLLVVMNALFWKPLLSHIKGREQGIANAYQTVEDTRHEMERLRADYQARITQIEAEARTRISTAVKEAQTERERLLSQAREESDATLKAGIADMQREKVEALQSLRGRMAGLAVTAVGKALGPAANTEVLRRSVEERLSSESANA